MNLIEALKEYDNIVKDYKDISFDDVRGTSGLMKQMAVCLSYLTIERVAYQKLWNGVAFKHVGTNAAGEKLATEAYPQLYQLRRIHEAGKNILDTMRSQISLLKQEN